MLGASSSPLLLINTFGARGFDFHADLEALAGARLFAHHRGTQRHAREQRRLRKYANEFRRTSGITVDPQGVQFKPHVGEPGAIGYQPRDLLPKRDHAGAVEAALSEPGNAIA